MNFEIVGKIVMSEPTEKFNPYRQQKYASTWADRTLLFNIISGDNRINAQVKGGYYPDAEEVILKTQIQEEGVIKNVSIPWEERSNSDWIKKVVNYRKYTVDLDVPMNRKRLYDLNEALKNGVPITEEELKSVGLTSVDDIKTAYETSLKKKRVFLSQWDMAEYMYKILTSGKYASKMFKIKGNIQVSYNSVKETWYRTYAVNDIFLEPDDAEPYAFGDVVLLFSKDAVDSSCLEEKHRYYVNGYSMEYNNYTKTKNDLAYPFRLSIPDKIHIDKPKDSSKKILEDTEENQIKKAQYIVKKFEVDDDSVKEYGVRFKILDGSQRVPITEDMLTQDQLDDLAFGVVTFDDIRAEMGWYVYGDKVSEYVYDKPKRGYTKGVKNTDYTTDIFELRIPKPEPKAVEEPKKSSNDIETDLDELFGVDSADDDILNDDIF